jgi:DNA polymerase
MTWEELEAGCMACQGCGLAETRRNVVFGVGNRNADVLFIGEGPGEQEDIQGVPFVGPAGQLLDVMLSLIDLDRSRVYIANIVKCRPPRNRDPLNTEQDACIGYLRAQTALIRPKIIVCLGRIAAMRIIDREFRITRQHGQWFQRAGVHMTALYHPSALLRDPSKRPETFVDLKGIQAKIRQVCPDAFTDPILPAAERKP